MTRSRLRLVAHVSLAILLIVNGPTAAALASLLPPPPHEGGPPCASPCTSEDTRGEGGQCPCCAHADPVEEEQPATSEGDDSAPPEAAGSPSCPCCPASPHDPQRPHCPGCVWCGAAKAPCCLDARPAPESDPYPGSPLSERSQPSLCVTPDELCHPPRV
jgi:hypothetical protein